MQTVSHKQLSEKIESNDNALVINVLSHSDFIKEHIPGSLNIPLESADFIAQVEKHAGGKEQEIIVYCASKSCSASEKAAKKLEKAGFSNVYDYEGGMKDWKESGHDVRGEEGHKSQGGCCA